MILILRNSAVVKLLWVLMGLYILNLSADTADPESPNIAEDLSINDQESMIEVLIESVLGFEDTFEEYEDPDGDDHNKKTTQKIDLVLHNPANQQQLYLSCSTDKNRFSEPRIVLSLGFFQLDSPPPNS